MNPVTDNENKDNHQVDVSFIIVSWNAKRYLLGCLKSLRETQRGYTSEVIVVDNASTDGSPEAVREQFPEAHLFCNPTNVGFAGANNLGLRHARGRYWCLVNSDVEVLEDCMPQLLRELQTNPRLGMIGPRLLEADGRTQVSCWGFPSLWNMFCCALALDRLFSRTALFNGYEMRHFARTEPREVDILGGAFWLTRREAVQQVGPLDEGFFMYGEDMDWCKRFWQHGWKLSFFPPARAIHYGGASSANAPVRFFIEMHRANLQYWRKHHARSTWPVMWLICTLHHLVRIAGHFCGMLFLGSKRAEHRYKLQRSRAFLSWLWRAPFRVGSRWLTVSTSAATQSS